MSTIDSCNNATIIYNEGWYNNKNIADRFLRYSSLRAIENRKSIIRASNQGYSSLTDKIGEIISVTDEEGSLLVKAELNNKITFYCKYGDVIGLVALFTLGMVLFFKFSSLKRNYHEKEINFFS
jgi:apolipoprotein N-acyltransferase